MPTQYWIHERPSTDACCDCSGLITFVCRAQCPFSKKAYAMLRKQVVPHYKDKSFRFIFYHQVQP